MSKSKKAELCEEIDNFLVASKSLKGTEPIWRENGRPDQLDAKWPILEANDVSRAHLTFRFNRVSTGEPSVSLIYKGKKVCRVDIKWPTDVDGNPLQAAEFGLPGEVRGSHVHKWEYNRKYVLESLPPDEWEIPIKEEISQSTQKLGHLLAFICDTCGVSFTPEQRELSPPDKMDLFG